MIVFLLSLFGIYLLGRIVSVVVEGSFLSFVDWFQKKTGVSDSVAGELFQAIGTSAPEIAINGYATYIALNNPALGISAIIGSALFQLTVVIAFPMFFVDETPDIDKTSLFRSFGVYGCIVLLLVFAARDGVFTTLELGLFMIIYGLYVIYLLNLKAEEVTLVEGDSGGSLGWFDDPFYTLSKWIDDRLPQRPILGFPLSLALIGILCGFLVELTEYAGMFLGLSSSFMALTVLAAASSLPELASNKEKGGEGKMDQAISNAIGSNSFDILISFGAVSFFAAWMRGGLVMPDPMSVSGPAFLLLLSLLSVLVMFWIGRWKVKKWMPYTLLVIYFIFVGLNLLYIF